MDVTVSYTDVRVACDIIRTSCLLDIQYEKRSPTLWLDGSALTRIEPRIATQYARAAEYARPFFQYVADVTVQKITMTIQEEISSCDKLY